MKRIFIAGTVAALFASAAPAETLREALVWSYNSNPTLTAQREALKFNDAGVALARSAGRPQVTARVGLNRDLTQSGSLRRLGKGPFVTGGVDFSLPVFSGGAVKNGVRAAKTRVEAGRATLRAVEGDVFAAAVAAYMDVIRDRAIVELNQNQVKVLTTNLQATSDRFEIGDVTRTDVAQSEARLALAQSALDIAQGTLVASEENYRRIVGKMPGDLRPPPPLPPLPQSPDMAVRIALADNPDLVAARRNSEAARYDVRVASASRLPTVSGVASGDYVNTISGNTGGAPREGTSTTIGVQTSIPIFQGGRPSAQVRQSQALQGQALERQVETERLVISNTRSAYANYQAAKQAIQANQTAVSANELALEGARAEQSVGTRTVLEVLNAEQELLDAQVGLVRARRNEYVAGFNLLNSMGQAEADDLGLEGGPLYDPLGNYRRVAGDWSDWSGERRDMPIATSTATAAERGEDSQSPSE